MQAIEIHRYNAEQFHARNGETMENCQCNMLKEQSPNSSKIWLGGIENVQHKLWEKDTRITCRKRSTLQTGLCARRKINSNECYTQLDVETLTVVREFTWTIVSLCKEVTQLKAEMAAQKVTRPLLLHDVEAMENGGSCQRKAIRTSTT
jgi:hypothetical protein